jgi:hypothetical protein
MGQGVITENKKEGKHFLTLHRKMGEKESKIYKGLAIEGHRETRSKAEQELHAIQVGMQWL